MNIPTRLLLLSGLLCASFFLSASANAQQTVTCESNNGSRKYCGSANPGQVSMQRQISGAACVQGQSWGVDNQGLWVDKGCRAEFVVGGWNNGGGNANSVTCESNDGRRKYCGNANPNQVSMQRQLSSASCMQGETWGVDNQGLWVDRGCRAVFVVGNGWNGNGGNNNWSNNGNGNWNNNGNNNWNNNYGNYPPVANFPRVNVDTSGRGNFNSQNLGSGNVTRGYVDTKSGRPSVSLSGSGGFKVTFYGDVVQAQDRRIVIRINGSNRGRANGQADIYLNGDKNEVQSINISGANFNGDFNRK